MEEAKAFLRAAGYCSGDEGSGSGSGDEGSGSGSAGGTAKRRRKRPKGRTERSN